jgi:1,2-diacylglycerol 3-beta-galactosyltransferase
MLIHGAHEVMNAAIERDGHIPNLTVVTDAVSIRPSWVHAYCDQIVVSTPEARQAATALGMAPERIELIGHPLDVGFAEAPRSRQELRRRYFLQQDLFTVMMMMGGTGGRNIYRFSRALIKAGLPVQILACCGSDQHLYHQMERLAKTSAYPIRPYAYTTEIAQLMAASDLLVTKPGPGTIMEAMAMELPMILDDSNYTMWQEKGNVDFVRNANLGRVIGHTREFIPVMQELLAHPERHAAMKEAVQRNRCDNAGLQIVQLIHQRITGQNAKQTASDQAPADQNSAVT